MNEHDRLKRMLDQFREITPPRAVRDSNREAVRIILDMPRSPWWTRSVMVPIPAVLGTAAALLLSLGIHLFPGQGVGIPSLSDEAADLPSGRDSTVLAVSDGKHDATSTTAPHDAWEKDQDPSELRRQVAGANPRERILLLRRAGDIYLLKMWDIEQALACYQQVLELTSPQEWAEVDPTDSWLLAELKQSVTLQRAGRS